MASTDYTFQGWMGLDKDSAKGNMKWQAYEPKTWEETDVDIKVTHCGICGSDLHMLRSGWVCYDPQSCFVVVKPIAVG
jgi:alcohol dehydrogenase (NADP+)